MVSSPRWTVVIFAVDSFPARRSSADTVASPSTVTVVREPTSARTVGVAVDDAWAAPPSPRIAPP